MARPEIKLDRPPGSPVARAGSDDELLARLRSGDRAAAYEFYERYSSRIHRFISHALAGFPPADAEDLLHETFMALADALPFFRGDCSLLTFACSIAHRKVASFLRTLARRRRLARPWLDEPTAVGHHQSAGHPEISAAMAAIKPQYRELLLLKYVEELSVGEISRVLAISEHAIESRLARARRALKREMQPE